LEHSGDITLLLREWEGSRQQNLDELFELVYPQLRSIASSIFRNERTGHLLQPTSVVNELFLKLTQLRKISFADRQHFYSFSARLMRRILVDHARSQRRQKRDGGTPVPVEENLVWTETSPEQMIDIDRLLERLEARDPQKCRLFELRCILGFTSEETADIMQVSKSSVDRDMRFVRSWLAVKLKRPAD
jgi:RNA polymerase sigma factor (TIGR02999 family)